MAGMEERADALERRIDELTAEIRCVVTIGTAAAEDARAAREAHRHSGELLAALRETQTEHTRTLAEHTRTLAEHTRTLAEHGECPDAIDGKLGQLALGMHTVEALLCPALGGRPLITTWRQLCPRGG